MSARATLSGMILFTACAARVRTSPARPSVPNLQPPAVRAANPRPAPGALEVTARDAATGRSLPVRVVVRGIAGTATPRFGPDHRADGAGPVVIALRGALRVSLPPGRYRVAVSHGPEWSIALRELSVRPGAAVAVDASLERVVPLDGWVPCDLHVHARPSGDSAVSIEDRVASLVAEGVRFAAPTEHNVVGDYATGVAALPEGTDGLAWVPAVEVTTDPRVTPLGHFNVFPYPPAPGLPGGGPPPWTNVSAAEIFQAARRRSPGAIIQVNHPRMEPRIGYFDVTGLDPYANRAAATSYDPGFDAVEVFNGYDLGRIDTVERVLADYMAMLGTGARYVATGSSDSHTVAFQTAGYPRTYVHVGEASSARGPDQIIDALRRGRAFVSAGPMVLLTLDGRAPGEDLAVTGPVAALARLRVLAAPWVTVREATLWRDGQRVAVLAVAPSSALVRLDRVVSLEVGPGSAVLATARGEDDSLDAVLPWSHATPYAFTNPVFVRGVTAQQGQPARPQVGSHTSDRH